MRSNLLRAILATVLLCASVHCFSQESKPQENPDLSAANEQFQAGKFSEAITKYQQALKAEPTLIVAQAGLIRAYLRADQVDAAYDLAKNSLAANPNSAQPGHDPRTGELFHVDLVSGVELRWDQSVERSAQDFRRTIAKDSRRPMVEENDLLLGIDRDNTILGDIENVRQPLRGNRERR